MEKNKWFIVTSITILLLLGVMVHTIYQDRNGSCFEMNGIACTVQDLLSRLDKETDTFCGVDQIDSKEARLKLSNIKINKSKIACTMRIFADGKETRLSVNGKLRQSYKVGHGINSTIVQVDYVKKGYEIMLFEIVNGESEEEMILQSSKDKKLSQMPHMKIYIKDKNKAYLFESEVDESFKRLEGQSYQMADRTHDYLWKLYLKEGKGEQVACTEDIIKEVSLDSVLENKDSQKNIWIPDTAYTSIVKVGNDLVKYTSVPYIEYDCEDVWPWNSEWKASFHIAECTSHINSNFAEYDHNIYQYNNLDMGFKLGEFTICLRTEQDGRMRQKGTKKPFDDGDTIEVSVRASSDNVVYHDKCNLTLGEGIHLYDLDTNLVGQKLEKYCFSKSSYRDKDRCVGDYYEYIATVSYESDLSHQNPKNYQTEGELYVSFDVVGIEKESIPVFFCIPIPYKVSKE